MGYNPHYRGRSSYHPLLAFDGVTGACRNAKLQESDAPSGQDAVAFLQETEAQLPKAARIRYVRMDKGFVGQKLYSYLEGPQIGYVGKVRWTDPMQGALSPKLGAGSAWPRTTGRAPSPSARPPTGTGRGGWRSSATGTPSRPPQGVLSEEALWSYEAMVTHRDWDPEGSTAGWAFGVCAAISSRCRVGWSATPAGAPAPELAPPRAVREGLSPPGQAAKGPGHVVGE